MYVCVSQAPEIFAIENREDEDSDTEEGESEEERDEEDDQEEDTERKETDTITEKDSGSTPEETEENSIQEMTESKSSSPSESISEAKKKKRTQGRTFSMTEMKHKPGPPIVRFSMSLCLPVDVHSCVCGDSRTCGVWGALSTRLRQVITLSLSLFLSFPVPFDSLSLSCSLFLAFLSSHVFSLRTQCARHLSLLGSDRFGLRTVEESHAESSQKIRNRARSTDTERD